MTASIGTDRVGELIGIYHANGGPVGEAKYILEKLLGTAHCALCDITHSPLRRKPAWDAMVAALGVPFTLVHLNELSPDVAEVVAATGSPVVLARLADAAIAEVLGPDELETLGGSVDAFQRALTDAAQRRDWLLGARS